METSRESVFSVPTAAFETAACPFLPDFHLWFLIHLRNNFALYLMQIKYKYSQMLHCIVPENIHT